MTSDHICTPSGPWPPLLGEVLLVISDPRRISAAQIDLHYPLAYDIFDDADLPEPRCTSDIPGVLTAFHSEPGVLHAGIISLEGFQGPYVLFHCSYFAYTPGPSSAFRAEWIDGTDPAGELLDPFPPVFVEVH